MQVRQQIVLYFKNSIEWFFNNDWHRGVDLPAVYNFRDGNVFAINHCQHGQYHRATGPAYIDYEFKTKSYFYQGKKYASLEEIQMVEACR